MPRDVVQSFVPFDLPPLVLSPLSGANFGFVNSIGSIDDVSHGHSAKTSTRVVLVARIVSGRFEVNDHVVDDRS